MTPFQVRIFYVIVEVSICVIGHGRPELGQRDNNEFDFEMSYDA